jgi:clan AA aspartic protease (TIGR02281 family)
MKKQILWIFLLVTLTSSVFAQTKIMMQKEGGVYTIPCKVNGLQLKFIFDTGASDVSISLTEALFMLKNGYLSENDITGTQKYSIANGDIAEGTTILLKVIEIADLKLYNVEASIVHELGAPLLLGQTAIAKLGKIQLDGNELIVMTKGSNSYDYSNTYATNNSNTQSEINYPSDSPYSKNFTGTQAVYSYSPILEKPDMINSKTIGQAENNSVTILEKYNEKYYKVKSGNTVGYLWAGWFKK